VGHWIKGRYVTAVSNNLYSSAFIGVSRAACWKAGIDRNWCDLPRGHTN